MSHHKGTSILINQNMSHKRKWTIKKIGAGIELFRTEYGRYPVAGDFDTADYLPSARHIQRMFGGLVDLRKKLKLKGQENFTKGSYSHDRSIHLRETHQKIQKKLREILLQSYSLDEIHQNSPIDDGRCTLDFKPSNEAQNCAVEGFYSKDDRVLIGCIRSRLQKYAKIKKRDFPIYLVSMNPQISQNRIDRYVQGRAEKLPQKIYVLSIISFKEKLSAKMI